MSAQAVPDLRHFFSIALALQQGERRRHVDINIECRKWSEAVR